MDDKSLIDDEIAAIRSIYEEEDIFSYDAETRRGRFFAKYESPSQFLVNIGTIFWRTIYNFLDLM